VEKETRKVMADGFDPLKDPSFQNASSDDQHAYLSSVDPGYSKASPDDQKAYRQHVTTITNPEAMFSSAQQQAHTETAQPIMQARGPHESILHAKLRNKIGQPEMERQTMPLLNAAKDIGIGASMVTPGLGEATLPSMIAPIARTAIGGTIGAIGGERAGSAVGGLAGPTGREIGGTIGSLAGGALGGGMAANMRRLPATFEEAAASQPGRIRPMPMGIQRAIPEWMVPKGRIGSVTNPGPPIDALRDEMYSDLGDRLVQRGKEETSLAAQARRNDPLALAVREGRAARLPTRMPTITAPEPELGTAENPAWHSKLPDRFPAPERPIDPLALAIREGRAAQLPVRMPHVQSMTVLDESGNPIAAGNAPLRPLIGMPDEWNAYDQKMNVLRNEAKTAGTYHAARGGVGKKTNLQQRLGKKLSE
jgi:hypothetical protein